MDYRIESSTFNQINDLADQIIDLIYGKIPYFMAFAVENNTKTKNTEYKTFCCNPAEIKKKLYTDKYSPIAELFGIDLAGFDVNAENFALDKTECKKLEGLIANLVGICRLQRIPCFLMFPLRNKHPHNQQTPPITEYLMDIVSPYSCMMNIYDDKISKCLRYTFAPGIYPSTSPAVSFELSDEEFATIANIEAENYKDLLEPKPKEKVEKYSSNLAKAKTVEEKERVFSQFLDDWAW